MTYKYIWEAIKSIGMITPYNLQAFISKSENLHYSLRSPDKHLKFLADSGLIKLLAIKPKQWGKNRSNKFYVPVENKRDAIALTKLDHESALNDVLFAFYVLYGGSIVEIKRTPTLKITGQNKFFLKRGNVHDPANMLLNERPSTAAKSEVTVALSTC
jgi:hypothetical protein